MKIHAAASTGRTECQFVVCPENELEKIVIERFLDAYHNRQQDGSNLVIHGSAYQIGEGLKSFNFGLAKPIDKRFVVRKPLWKRLWLAIKG